MSISLAALTSQHERCSSSDGYGIGKLHPHMLRHTYLTRLYNVEHDLRFVQDQAGHASPTTTAIYAKTNSKARKRQVEALDDYPS